MNSKNYPAAKSTIITPERQAELSSSSKREAHQDMDGWLGWIAPKNERRKEKEGFGEGHPERDMNQSPIRRHSGSQPPGQPQEAVKPPKILF